MVSRPPPRPGDRSQPFADVNDRSQPPPPNPADRIGAPAYAAALSPAARARLAGLPRRIGASAFDLILLVVLASVAFAITGTQDDTATGLGAVIATSLWLNGLILGEVRTGRTPGKMILGLRVVGLDGGNPSWNRALGRALMRLPDTFTILFTVPTSRLRRRMGDSAAGTLVLRWDRDAAEPPELRELLRAATAPDAPVPASQAAGAAWGPGRVLGGLAALLLALVLAGVVAGAIDPDLESTASILVLQALLAVAMLGVSFAAPTKDGLAAPGQLGLGRALHKPFRTAATGYAVYIGFALVISALLAPEQEDIARDLGVDEGVLGAIAAGFLIVIAAPIAEEVFFRGFMFAGFRSAMPFWLAAGLSGTVFGSFHFTGGGSLPVVLQLSIFGAILAWVYERSGSIRPAIAMHMLNNAIAFTVLLAT